MTRFLFFSAAATRIRIFCILLGVPKACIRLLLLWLFCRLSPSKVHLPFPLGREKTAFPIPPTSATLFFPLFLPAKSIKTDHANFFARIFEPVFAPIFAPDRLFSVFPFFCFQDASSCLLLISLCFFGGPPPSPLKSSGVAERGGGPLGKCIQKRPRRQFRAYQPTYRTTTGSLTTYV